MYKKFILLSSILLMSVLATIQAQDSYIIVHVLNPEGVEIGTIEDLYQNIEIYDGANFIGYAPHNEESHNVPIEIGPGTHTIKVEFNGMTKEQVIELSPGQTKNIVFNFERSEFDLAGYLDSVGGTGNINLSKEVTWISELSDEEYEQDEPFGLTLGYTALFTKSQPSFSVTWKVEGSAQSVFNSQNFRLHASIRSQIVEATNCGGTVCLWVESEEEICSSGLNIPISTDFNDWFVQYIQDGWWPIITVGTSSPPYYVGNPIPGIRGTDPPSGLYPDSGYHCHKLPSNENYTGMGIIWMYSDQGDYVEVVLVSGFNRVETIASNLNPTPPEREFTFEGELQGLTMSSVPYDLLGTGIHCDGVGPQPPENQPDLIGEFTSISFIRPTYPGADFQAEVRLLITNNGEVATQPEQVIDMAFFLRPIDASDGSEDILVSTLNNILIDQLEPGRSKRIRLSVPIYIPSFTYGTYRLGVYIDSSNDVLESNEGNNVITSNAIISIHGGIPVWIPDLTGEISKVSFRNSPSPGVEGRAVIDVNNIGTGQTASKQVIDIEICLRPSDATDDTDDITLLTLEDQPISKLAPGRSKTFRTTFNLPADLETGEYLLVAKIDSSELVEELKEDNNEALSECFEVLGEQKEKIIYFSECSALSFDWSQGGVCAYLRFHNITEFLRPMSHLWFLS